MAFDTSRRFVRVNKLRDDGFVEFDFAIGEPELFVEMLLPKPAFTDFCLMYSVQIIESDNPRPTGDSTVDGLTWSLRDAVQSLIKSSVTRAAN